MRNGKELSEYCNIIWLFIFILGILGAFYYGFFILLRAYTFWKRVIKIHVVGFFFCLTFFFPFLQIHILKVDSQVGKVGGW